MLCVYVSVRVPLPSLLLLKRFAFTVISLYCRPGDPRTVRGREAVTDTAQSVQQSATGAFAARAITQWLDRLL